MLLETGGGGDNNFSEKDNPFNLVMVTWLSTQLLIKV